MQHNSKFIIVLHTDQKGSAYLTIGLDISIYMITLLDWFFQAIRSVNRYIKEYAMIKPVSPFN